MLEPEERKRVSGKIIRMLKGRDGMRFDTVIASARNADEAADAFRAGADGVMIEGQIIFRDQTYKAGS